MEMLLVKSNASLWEIFPYSHFIAPIIFPLIFVKIVAILRARPEYREGGQVYLIL